MNNFIRRASSFMGLSSEGFSEQLSKMDEKEMIYCKNNVCVHPPSVIRDEPEHHPGYLTIKAHHSETSNSMLVLGWIPNSSIKRNPRSLENRTPTHSPCHSSRSSACPSPRKSPRHSLTFSTNSPNFTLFGNEKCAEDDFVGQFQQPSDLDRVSGPLQDDSVTSVETPTVEESENLNRREVECNVDRTKSNVDSGIASENVSVNALETIADVSDSSLLEMSISESGRPVFTCDIELVEDGDRVEPQYPPAEETPSDVQKALLEADEKKLDFDNLPLKKDLNLNLEICASPESREIPCSQSPNHSISETLSLTSHELDFEEVAQSNVFDKTQGDRMDLCDSETFGPTSPLHKCTSYSSFSIDLCQMKSLRLLFNNQECTCGQLVIASRERRYKILHFHHGGLDKLAKIFEELDFLTKSKEKVCPLPYRLFSVSRPVVSEEECHPEEGLYCTVDESIWESHLNEYGQIEDEAQLRKSIFFGGLGSNMRSEIWPFLLHCYSFMSTYEAREQIREEHELEYQKVDQRRENLSHQDKNSFYRNIECIVEKDVVRTDRSHPFFAGSNNPNVEIMKCILLNYAIYNPSIGYTQGMSDILAPILIELKKVSETFWCFVDLMQRTIFISSPTDNDMDLHLNYIRELIRLMVPNFYQHLLTHPDYMELLFCHRWILLCFKREFPELEALKMWEACWAQYQTKYFHLFLCVAIVAIYSEDVIQQDMNSDEMLLYFSSLSMHMNGDLVLRKARGLLYQFLQLPTIPCSLVELCEPVKTDKWDNEFINIPEVVCTGHKSQNEVCSRVINGGSCPQ